MREINRRNKVGGILDRRFGEDDPTMTPEERAAERFARESQKKLRKESMFNLEDDEEEIELTHKGQSLNFDEGMNQDDFQDDDLEEDDMSDGETSRKRKRFVDDHGDMEEYIQNDDEEQPGRKKSKHEVMKEVIAKSKFYKHERQKAKEDDDDLRAELDKQLPDLFSVLRGAPPPPPKPEPAKEDLGSMNPERAALLDGTSKKDADKEYDQQLKQLTFDKRSKPTDRTKTEEEKAEEEAQRLKALEEERLRRMRGEELSDAEDDAGQDASEHESIPDDAKAFGLQQAPNHITTRPELGVEDEDDFVIDDDLVETRSDVSLEFDESEEEEESGESFVEESGDDFEDDEYEDLFKGLALPTQVENASATADGAGVDKKIEGLAFTYPCPEDHDSFLKIIKDISMQELPTVIQRIRALHHPRLHQDNKAKLGRFSAILVEHVAYMANQPEHPPFAILENILRHVHSLAKSHPDNVSMAFRTHLRKMAADRPLNLLPGDLVILTGIATIFPTSDHFHAVATPAHLCLARYLEQGAINSLRGFATGAYAASLCLQYQTVSKRYMPEFINYVLNALCNLCPEEMTNTPGFFSLRKPQEPLRLSPSSKRINYRKLRFWDMVETEDDDTMPPSEKEELKLSLAATFISLLDAASDLWSGKSAFFEIFEPAQIVLQYLRKSCKGKLSAPVTDMIQACLDKLDQHLSQARLTRRPLLLHNHRPLAIKSSIPKFEENFNPDKHYDPNRERAELNRLKAEYKRERKGAMRELRKDANFITREKLREKKERDAEYEKKYKRLIAEIQNGEGREANAYEKEKRLRQGKR